jgi:hypothetical protein
MPLSFRNQRTHIEPFQVVAFDPGGTTGWAVAGCQGGPIDEIKLSDINVLTGSFGPHEHHDELFTFLLGMRSSLQKSFQIYSPDFRFCLVSEAFEFRQFARAEGDVAGRSKLELISREYIGIIRLCASLWNLPYASYNAGEAKRYVPNEKLERLGWLQKPVHPNRHKNDALRQLVKYLIVGMNVKHPITTTWLEDDEAPTS